MQALLQSDYLLHLKGERRFELGDKLDRLGVSLHRQIGVPTAVRAEVTRLHDTAQTAGSYAVYRGADVVVAHVVDSPDHPRLTPLGFGSHLAAHATAFGKIMLIGMSIDQVNGYLGVHGMPRYTETTMFVPGMTCAAVGVRNGAGMIVGAVAISAPSEQIDAARERALEPYLREAWNHVSKCYRSVQLRKVAGPPVMAVPAWRWMRSAACVSLRAWSAGRRCAGAQRRPRRRSPPEPVWYVRP
ncbi:hypothetical protein B7R22_04195 [Subtercola boreus]|uniref:IclR-ED domain-containing protein n=1 Tax=Subtercola boreus TaxID=120213 RepID=A0A3E0W2S0_9MICO|nr:IclR family transcriptional regulator C-terminal domain-containing protein [Subtercola boreus]RFA16674.1 hypothetical protein B7R22_04195 [Subtercola boreus]